MAKLVSIDKCQNVKSVNIVKYSFSSSSSKVFLAANIQWKVEYSHNQQLHLYLVGGALSAKVYYSIEIKQNATTANQLHHQSGVVTVKKGQSASLGNYMVWNYHQNQQSLFTTLELLVLDSSPKLAIPDELTLLSDLSSTLDSEKGLNDVTLYFGEKKEPQQVNKFMLMARSPVFTTMFQSKFREAESCEVEIPDIRPEVGQELITYIYTDQAINISSMTEELWLAADKYQLPGLKALCENELARQLTLDNAAHTLLFVGQYCGDGELKEHVLTFITKDKQTCSDVMKSKEWREVEKFPEIAYAVTRKFFDVPLPPKTKKARKS